METKHTPGPWAVRIDPDGQSCGSDDGPLVEVVGQDGEVVCCNERYYPTRLDQKNAHLIAAAPDMLEALQNIENDDAHMPGTAWKLIQEAIAKATGDTP